MQKVEKNKVSNGHGVRIFGRICVEWRSLTMDILAYRALLAPNFVEKASLILLSIEIMCGIILI